MSSADLSGDLGRKARRRGETLVRHLWVLGGCVVALVPIVWGISESVHTNSTFFAVPYSWIPRHPAWSNYSNGWRAINFGSDVINSMIVAVVVSLATIAFGHMAAYSFAHFQYRGKTAMFSAIVATLLLPFSAIMVPVYELARLFGMVNSLVGLIVPGLITPQAIFFFRQYIQGIPKELSAAARVDGASEWGIYWRIILPLSSPAIVAVGVLTFIASWTNLLWPLIVVQSNSLNTVPLGLAQFNSTNFTNYVDMIALALLSILPIVVLFLFVQRRLVSNLMASGGALK